MRYAVTGGAGFVGSMLTKTLLAFGHDVTVIDNMSTGTAKNLEPIINKIRLKKTDIRDCTDLVTAVADVDGIFHQAALTSVKESFINPSEYHDVNVTGTENVFKAAKKSGIRVVYASSCAVYGNTLGPTAESVLGIPTSPYGKTKLNAEVVAQKYADIGVSTIVLRYFNVYGPGQTLPNAGVITQFIQRLLKKKPPIIRGDGSQSRDFVHISDVVKANIIAMATNGINGSQSVFNIGTGVSTPIERLAKIMIRLYDLPLKAEFTDSFPGEIQESQADTSLANNMLPWKHTVSLEEGLAETIAASCRRC